MTVAERVANVRAVWPLLAVDDLEASMAFYRDMLGFRLVGQADADGTVFWCRLERDGASIMLQAAELEDDGPASGRGRGVSLYFVCDDVDALHQELSSRGLRLDEPHIAYYAMKQLFVPDPNGYVVCFESHTDTPAEGAGS